MSHASPDIATSHAGMAEQCLTVEALAEEVGALSQPGAVQEIATSEIISQDMLLEDASLEVGESHQPYQTSLVIEETLVNGSSDVPTGSLTVPHSQVGESLSVVTVMRVSGFTRMSFACCHSYNGGYRYNNSMFLGLGLAPEFSASQASYHLSV